MEERVTVTLDFTKCKYLAEVYQEMSRKMEWAEEYGDNLSALWDILRGMPHKGNDFIILRPMAYTDIPYGHNESFTRYIDKICHIFLRAQQQQC